MDEPEGPLEVFGPPFTDSKHDRLDRIDSTGPIVWFSILGNCLKMHFSIHFGPTLHRIIPRFLMNGIKLTRIGKIYVNIRRIVPRNLNVWENILRIFFSAYWLFKFPMLFICFSNGFHNLEPRSHTHTDTHSLFDFTNHVLEKWRIFHWLLLN